MRTVPYLFSICGGRERSVGNTLYIVVTFVKSRIYSTEYNHVDLREVCTVHCTALAHRLSSVVTCRLCAGCGDADARVTTRETPRLSTVHMCMNVFALQHFSYYFFTSSSTRL